MKLFLKILIWLAPLVLRGQAFTYGKLGGGNNSQMPIRCLFYDTIDKKLYAGGQFVLMDNKKVWGIAVWNGIKWDSLRGGLSQNPNAFADSSTQDQNWAWKITRYQNKIYVVGAISYVNRNYQGILGVWNGTSWDLPTNQHPNGAIHDMKVINGDLCACGLFTKFGNIDCNFVAKFDGINWQPVGDLQKYFGSNSPAHVFSLAYYKNEIYVGGAWDDSMGVTRNIAKFNGTQWVNVGQGIQQGGIAMVNTMESSANYLYIGGTFSRTGAVPGKNLVAWDGTNFIEINQFDPENGAVISLTRHKNKVYAFGYIYNYGPYPAYLLISLADKQQCAMTALKSTLTNLDNDGRDISALEFMGDSLVIGGNFPYLNKIRVNGIGVVSNFEESLNCLNVGLGENELQNVKIFPNPTNNKITIETGDLDINGLNLSLYNNLGQYISSVYLDRSQNEIDMSRLPTGIYFLKLGNTQSQKDFKIIKE